MTEKKSLTPFESFVAVAGVLGAAYLVSRCISGDKPGPEAQQAPSAPAPTRAVSPLEAAPPTSPSCVISMPGQDGEVPLFPTEEGFDEFTKFVTRNTDGNARLTVFRANGGFYVDKGTLCSPIDTGFTSSHIRVLEGPHAGKSGWVPTEWRMGK